MVLDGARALAVPSHFGQRMEVMPISEPELHWKSFTNDRQLWFEGYFALGKSEIKLLQATDKTTAHRLLQLFSALTSLNPQIFQKRGYAITTCLEFPRDWGLGSSSTLVASLAQWAGVNPFALSDQTFGGSAYDIACAQSDSPLLYERTADSENPKVKKVHFAPSFSEKLFFVHRNQKQNTRVAVAHYKKHNPSAKKQWIVRASKLTDRFITCSNLRDFEFLINEHEQLLGQVLGINPVKQQRFSDFPGAIKSLGAWGGDFMLATGGESAKNYFKQKGYTTILDYIDMVKG